MSATAEGTTADPAELLLAGPLGRAFVAWLCDIDLAEYADPPRSGARYRAPAGRVGGDRAAGTARGGTGSPRPWEAPDLAALERRLAAMSAAGLMSALGAIVEDFAFGAYERWRVAAAADALPWHTLAAAAAAVTRQPACAWWWTPKAGPQLLAEDHLAVAAGETAEGPGAADPPGGDVWWSQPTGPGIPRSCGTVPGTDTPTSALCHDDQLPADADVSYRPVTVTSRTLFVVTGPDDWVRLATRHPRTPAEPPRDWVAWTGRPGPWVVPDWPAVAREHDGVLVTIGGALATAYRELPTASGSAMLAGWNPGETCWLDGGRNLRPAA